MLTVVIPTYNEEDFLPRLLESFKRQTYRDLEIIVADASSVDRTRAIAESYGCRVVRGGLPSVGRNAGAAAAKGELLLFLDADVELPDPDFIGKMVAAFERRRLDVATTFITIPVESAVDAVFYGFYNSWIYATQKFMPHAHGFCIMARKSCHDAIGGFDPEVLLAEDHDYAQRAAKAGARFGVLRDIRIPVSSRRFERDGYVGVAARYMLCELHMWTLGSVKTDIFKYRFGYSKEIARKEIRR